MVEKLASTFDVVTVLKKKVSVPLKVFLLTSLKGRISDTPPWLVALPML